jgi:hypothetical protein
MPEEPRFSTLGSGIGGDGWGGGGDGAPPPTAPVVGGRKVLTEADILSRSAASRAVADARMDGGLSSPESQQAAPRLFSSEVYDDFQDALLLLEKRVGGGRGSLSPEDVSRFEMRASRIVGEMNDYLADPRGCGDRIAEAHARDAEEEVAAAVVGAVAADDAAGAAVAMPPPSPPPAAAAGAAAAASPPPPPAPPAPWMAVAPPPPGRGEPGGGRYRRAPGENRGAAPSPPPAAVRAPPPAPPPRPSATAAAVVVAAVVGDPAATAARYGDEEDADNVGFGLARGTTNTYVIPNMEEMSPEEYREKLQETISARQVS